MWRVLFLSSIAFLAFTTGVGLTSSLISRKSTPLSLCTVASQATFYNGKIIRVTGTLGAGDGNIFSFYDRSSGGEFGFLSLVELESQPGYKSLKEELYRLNTSGSYATTHVVLTGHFEKLERTCFSPPYLFTGAKIEQAEDVQVK